MSRLMPCLLLLVLAGCSNFESFALRLPSEIAYGDASLNASRDIEIAQIEGHTAEAAAANAPHTVNVKLPPEMVPAFEVESVPLEVVPPALAPGASGMATTVDGRTLYDCVEGKGGQVICFDEPGL